MADLAANHGVSSVASGSLTVAFGDATDLSGDVTVASGDATDVSGDTTEASGDITDLSGGVFSRPRAAGVFHPSTPDVPLYFGRCHSVRRHRPDGRSIGRTHATATGWRTREVALVNSWAIATGRVADS